jgi:hypothetical protein
VTILLRGSKLGFSRDTTTKDVVDGGYLVFSLGIDSKFPTESEVIQGCFTLPSLDPVNHMTDRRTRTPGRHQDSQSRFLGGID